MIRSFFSFLPLLWQRHLSGLVLSGSLVTALLLLVQTHAHAQRRLAITIDDPHTKESPILTWQERNARILKALDKHRIQAALFVCGMRVNDANGQRLLRDWDDRGHLICNHSFSHWYYPADSKTAAMFIRDFERGDSVIRSYQRYTKLFRFPYLKEGNTAGKRDSMRMAMQGLGYQNGYVTIDASDWFIDGKVNEELKKDPKADLTAYKEYYIRHILDRAHYYDSLATTLLNRKVKHTLLIHHSLLNALFLDDLLKALKRDGWELIDAKAAFEDEIFDLQPEIEPCGESIVWQCAKLDAEAAKGLRYPAEDSAYEEEGLKRAVEGYGKQKKAGRNR
ncbi:MAG: polysaccharide deacetylase family protein [Bacteroidia bacterium]